MRVRSSISRKLWCLPALCLATSLTSGCVVAPADGGYHGRVEYREGYYDRPHHRWYHDRHWVDCDRDDRHCR